jgi:serine palmitoyltransferase
MLFTIQEAICYSDGASAVTSAISAFAKKGDLLLVDEACGEPVMSGANLSRSTVRYFRHNDMNHLHQLLEAIAAEDIKLKRDTSQQRRFIVTEGIFRNTGNICQLPDIIKLKEKFYYRLFLDETLSFGTLGKTGRGVTEHFGMKTSDVEIITFSTDTVLASVGGVCVGMKEIVDHQRLSGAGYCYSASTAPFLCAAAVHSLKILEMDGVRLISNLQQNSQYLYNELSKVAGIKIISNSASPVMHIVFTNSEHDASAESSKIKQLAHVLLENGLLVAISSFKLLKVATGSKGHLFRPSLMLCVNATWDSSMLSRIVQIITKSVER